MSIDSHGPFRLLHISDLHLVGRETTTGPGALSDAKVAGPDVAFEQALTSFEALLRKWAQTPSFDAIVVSGDIAHQGLPQGFETFQTRLLDLLHAQLRTRNTRALCLVPGNHDVQWAVPSTTPAYFDTKFERFRALAEQAGATTSLLPIGRFRDDPQAVFRATAEGEGPLYLDPALRIAILCINSSVRCGELHEEFDRNVFQPLKNATGTVRTISETYPDDKALHNLDFDLRQILLASAALRVYDVAHVTQGQLHALEAALETAREQIGSGFDGWFKIATLHHHVMPYPRQVTELKPFELLADTSHVLGMLEQHGFQLLLTGHKHHRYLVPRPGKAEHGQCIGDLLIHGAPTACGKPAEGQPRGVTIVDAAEGRFSTTLRIVPVELGTNPASHSVEAYLRNAQDVKTHVNRSRDFYKRQACLTVEPFEHRERSFSFLVSTPAEVSVFFNVVGCSGAREALHEILKRYANDRHIAFWGMYDLYGRWDLLVRAQGPILSNPDSNNAFVNELKNALKEKGQFHKDETASLTLTTVECRGTKTAPSSLRRLLANSRDYEDTRSYRAFVVLERLGADAEEETFNVVVEKLRKFATEATACGRRHAMDEGYWLVSRSDRAILIEALIQCGQQYWLQDFTQEIEPLVDNHRWQKRTHLAYVHEEWTHGTADTAIAVRSA